MATMIELDCFERNGVSIVLDKEETAWHRPYSVSCIKKDGEVHWCSDFKTEEEARVLFEKAKGWV